MSEVIAHSWPPGGAAPSPGIWAGVVGQVRSAGDDRRRRNVLPHFYPHLLVSGSGVFAGEGGRWTLGPGEMFCLWPGVEHDFREDPADPWTFYWMRLLGPDTESIVRDVGFAPDRPIAQPADPARAIRCFRELYEYYALSPHRDPYHAAGLLYELLGGLRQGTYETTDRPFRRLVAEAQGLAEELLSSGINVADLADRLGVTRQRLFLAFRQELGTSPTDYLQSIRLTRAQELLASTGIKISAVARACGYGSEKYFFRRFRAMTGMTPGQWRKGGR